MKSATVVAPARIELQDVAVPMPPPGWLTCRVQAAGICATDTEILEGTLPYLKTGRVVYPIVPGHEWSGVVSALGEGVAGFTRGDRVTGETHIGCGQCERCRRGQYNTCESLQRVGIGDIAGALAEYICVPARSLHHLPDNIDDVRAAVLEPATVALHALERAGLASGERVVVVGPGTIGLLAVALARALGAGHVTLLGTRADRLALGLRMGADMTVNVRQESLAWLMGKADVVVEASGNASFFGQACELLRRGGRLALVGLFRSEPPLLDLNQLVTRNLAVVGSLGSPGVWERTIALLAAGRLDPLPIITHRFPLDQVAQAFGVVADRATGAVKAMVMP